MFTTVTHVITQVIAPSLTFSIIRDEILEPLIELAKDPIPNIRFNAARAFEVLAVTFGSTSDGHELIQQHILPVLEVQKNDSDADVRFFASRALQKVAEL